MQANKSQNKQKDKSKPIKEFEIPLSTSGHFTENVLTKIA